MEYHEIAAKWWADRIRNINTKNFDNGEKSATSDMAMIIASVLARNSRPSEKAIDYFESRLANIIQEYVAKYGSTMLYTDYDPQDVLAELAQEAGISFNVFPWKTIMHITKDEITVSINHGDSKITIIPPEEVIE